MNVYFTKKATAKLERKLDYLQGHGLRELAERVAEAVREGNRVDRLSGVDSDGKPQTPVKPRKGIYKNAIGPPLAPFGATSRVVSRFRAVVKGSPGRFEVVAGWDNVVSKSGVPFLPFHDMGVRGSGSKKAAAKAGFFRRVLAKFSGAGWRLPQRKIFGLSPRTWRSIEILIDEFKRKAKKA